MDEADTMSIAAGLRERHAQPRAKRQIFWRSIGAIPAKMGS
jgi:hypothetical protein